MEVQVAKLNAQQITALLVDVHEAVERRKAELTQLDSYIGDGDHGFGMSNGFRIAAANVSQLRDGTIEEVLKTAGNTLIKEVGGASGTIFGSLFVGMGKAAHGMDEVGLAELAAMFAEGLVLVKQRGRAELGGKTMLDALAPAVDAIRESDQGAGLASAFERAAAAAEAGALATRDMPGKYGRAKYFKEKAVGFQDAGATTVSIIFRQIADSLKAM
jgi:dihydroxyacetone kinase-like protein